MLSPANDASQRCYHTHPIGSGPPGLPPTHTGLSGWRSTLPSLAGRKRQPQASSEPLPGRSKRCAEASPRRPMRTSPMDASRSRRVPVGRHRWPGSAANRAPLSCPPLPLRPSRRSVGWVSSSRGVFLLFVSSHSFPPGGLAGGGGILARAHVRDPRPCAMWMQQIIYSICPQLLPFPVAWMGGQRGLGGGGSVEREAVRQCG